MKDRSKILTEQRLKESMNLDSMSIADAIEMMNAQDMSAVRVVGVASAQIERTIRLTTGALSAGGRIIYVGAGTSGRLGVLDASECPPTFRTNPKQVVGIIAGGKKAMFKSQEGVEDQPAEGARQIDRLKVSGNDVVIGIAAGGTTPFVHGALKRARARKARSVFVTCAQKIKNEPNTDVTIRLLVGPEVLTGSTRLKAGTATKLTLNMITTLTMVQRGKVYENLMVDVKCSNAKLWDRGVRIISTLTGLDRSRSLAILKKAQGQVKAAVVMQRCQCSLNEANRLLRSHQGKLHAIVRAG